MTLFVIAQELGVAMDELAAANAIADVNVIEAGQVLRVPAGATVPARPLPVVDSSLPITERMTPAAQQAQPGSPFYRTTWLTYYGRPGIPLMGIMGEDEPITVTTWLRARPTPTMPPTAPDLGVTPAYHRLRHGNQGAGRRRHARRPPTPDDVVQKYVDAALAERSPSSRRADQRLHAGRRHPPRCPFSSTRTCTWPSTPSLPWSNWASSIPAIPSAT